MKNAGVCTECGRPLKWGHFAFNQEVCLDCFVKEIQEIQDNVDKYYPSWLRNERETHIAILEYLKRYGATERRI